MQDRITFAGLLTGRDKWAAYNRADILAHPTDLDGQPLAILEALGMGLAVISNPVGAIPDTVEDGKNGLLLRENTPACLCEAIRILYEDRNRLRQMQTYNRLDFERRFSVERYLSNFKRWMEAV
jgi:glycosyltransferase involved in cell wall biosynthesis